MADDNFEIKIEAYIDGVLPPHERAELERQLMSSPRHRRIVDQLMRARHLLATLPRVSAPADLLESIDPSLERAALFDIQAETRRRKLVSPQVLALAATVALAATLLTAMLVLMPSGQDVARVDSQAPDLPSGDGEQVAQTDQPTPNVTEQSDDAVEPRPTEVADGGDAMPAQPADPIADGGAPEASPLVQPLSERLADAVLISASVQNIPEASGTVFQYLAAADVPIESRRVPAAALPEAVRERLKLAGDAVVQVFTVGELSLQQVGALTSELAEDGTASALTPASVVAEHRTPVTQPQEPAENQNIHQEDLIEILVQRKDEAPAEPPPGVPALEKVSLIEVQVSSDGYADFGKIGLGRVDVLGKQPQEVAALVGRELRERYQIDAGIEVAIAAGGMLQAGRNRESVRLVYLDREPLKTGEMVQIELPDGAWLHAIVDEDGTISAGDFGRVEAKGRSATEVQQALHEIAVQRAASEAERNGEPPLTTARAPRPMRVVNLSARRAAGVDSFAATKVPCLIVLTGQDSQATELSPEQAPQSGTPADRGAGQPSPATEPASIDPVPDSLPPLPPKRRPN